MAEYLKSSGIGARVPAALDMVDEYGFAGGYQRVKRFIKKLARLGFTTAALC